MLVPSEVIDRARGLHPSFHSQRHPPSVLVDALDAWQKDVLVKLQRVYSDELRLTETIDLPLADFDAGYELPAHTGVFEGLVYWNETEWPRSIFSLEAEEHAFDPQAWPSGFLRGRNLHLHAREEDWTRFDRIELPYAPEPATLDLETDTSSLPDEAARAARYRLAEVMAARHDGSEPAPDLGYFAGRADEYEDTFIRSMQLQGTAYSGKVRDVVRRRR
ncbi:MAG: hypothetical protein ACOC8K_03750 [Gemmatimonadota bacterium]